MALELGIESAHLFFVLVLKFVELKFSILSCQITDGLLSCMKVNADIYCVHSASFQSHVRAVVSLLLTGRRFFITSRINTNRCQLRPKAKGQRPHRKSEMTLRPLPPRWRRRLLVQSIAWMLLE